jgi:hypothetical protein
MSELYISYKRVKLILCKNSYMSVIVIVIQLIMVCCAMLYVSVSYSLFRCQKDKLCCFSVVLGS